ncbi:ATP-binding protein [Streptomyces sp. NPDC048441]|uniref:ATP-binding protein n=1 Tax=Streptomyces sp. NPDC048441 TaxID=3365552 RepID=UPI00371DEE52
MILNRGIGNDHDGGDPAPRRDPLTGIIAPASAGAAVLELPFTIADLARVRLHVTRRAEDAGLCDPRLSDFVLAVHEVASNAAVHGGGKGRLQLAHTDGELRCVITDSGPGLPQRKPPPAGTLPDCDEAENGRGLWLAEALADRFEVAACAAGTTVTLVALLG